MILIFIIFLDNIAYSDVPYFFEGARPLGVGGAFVAVADDENVIFYNPAGLSLINNKIINFSMGRNKSNNKNWKKYNISFANRKIGFNFYYSKRQPQMVLCFYPNPDNYEDIEIMFSLSSCITYHILSFGGTIKYVNINMKNDFKTVKKNGILIDIGMLLQPFAVFKFGLNINNIIKSDIGFSDYNVYVSDNNMLGRIYSGKLPIFINSGISYEFWRVKILIDHKYTPKTRIENPARAISFGEEGYNARLSFQKHKFIIGTEIKVFKSFFLRGGYTLSLIQTELSNLTNKIKENDFYFGFGKYWQQFAINFGTRISGKFIISSSILF